MITQYQGDDLDVVGEARDVDGAPVNLIGATLYCVAKNGAASQPIDSFTVLDGPAGTYRVRWNSATTAAMIPGSWHYDVRARLSTGELVTISDKNFFPLAAAKTPTP